MVYTIDQRVTTIQFFFENQENANRKRRCSVSNMKIELRQRNGFCIGKLRTSGKFGKT